MKVLGLMSGSSLDGLDLAYCSFEFKGLELRSWQMYDFIHAPFPPFLVEYLRDPLSLNPKQLEDLEIQFTEFMIAVIQDRSKAIDLIGSHGHTIQHLPEQGITRQLGLGKRMSAALQVEVVDTFRIQDIKAGGVGTPMAPLADRDLYPGYEVYLNIGGIANISYQVKGVWHAYDLAPANQILNHLAQQKGMDYDENGELAEEGEIIHPLLMKLLSHPYLIKNFPKSLDNTEVKTAWTSLLLEYESEIESTLHTFCHFLGLVLQRELVPSGIMEGKVLVTGGGVHNDYLMECLAQHNPGFKFQKPAEEVINYKEACLIAYAAACKKLNKPNFIASVTGALEDVIGGTIHNSK